MSGFTQNSRLRFLPIITHRFTLNINLLKRPKRHNWNSQRKVNHLQSKCCPSWSLPKIDLILQTNLKSILRAGSGQRTQARKAKCNNHHLVSTYMGPLGPKRADALSRKVHHLHEQREGRPEGLPETHPGSCPCTFVADQQTWTVNHLPHADKIPNSNCRKFFV